MSSNKIIRVNGRDIKVTNAEKYNNRRYLQRHVSWNDCKEKVPDVEMSKNVGLSRDAICIRRTKIKEKLKK